MSEVHNTSINMETMVSGFIPLNDYPTCKPLLELSAEDAVSVANDLNKNTLTEVVIGAGILGKKIGDIITISDIKTFYKDQISNLESEIAADRDRPSYTEEFLFDKFKAELGYCYKAMFKTGIGAAKEIIEQIATSDEAIKRYEDRCSSNDHYKGFTRLQDMQ